MRGAVVFGVDFTDWSTWAAAAVGIAVATLVVVLAVVVARWRRRRRLGAVSREEDLPWDEVLELLRNRKRQRVAAGRPPDDDDLPPDELLKLLVSGLSSQPRGSPEVPPEELRFLESGGAEQRAGRRRWGNPTEVYLTTAVYPERLHGLIINRSTGGLAIFVDKEVEAGASVWVRAVEAPVSLPMIEVEVRHSRKVGKNFLLGCQFSGEVPWNVRVWFG